MTGPPDAAPSPPTYATAGVDEEREQAAFARAMRPWLARTAVRSPLVRRVEGLHSGYFATVLHLASGPPLALTTDGVGTKILLACQARRYESVGVDCVANNVNDLVCVGAVPLALLDYLATDRIEEDVLAALARGLCRGAEEAGIAIPGGEIAQVADLLAPAGPGSPVFDLVGSAVGAFPPAPGGGWREPVDGSQVAPGDVVLGLPSSGLHSNGYSLARHVLLERGGLTLDDPVPGSGRSLADELLEPTRVYVRAVEALWDRGLRPRGLVNVSGGGLLNLGRLAADVSYRLDALPDPAPIFQLIQEVGKLPAATMFATFNMGIGFCVVVAEEDAAGAIDALRSAGEAPIPIGRVTGEPGRAVAIPAAGLAGRGDAFFPAGG